MRKKILFYYLRVVLRPYFANHPEFEEAAGFLAKESRYCRDVPLSVIIRLLRSKQIIFVQRNKKKKKNRKIFKNSFFWFSFKSMENLILNAAFKLQN